MRISEVSEKFGVSIDTLRYYERVGLLPTVNRKENGIRDFNEIDVEWVDFIICMRNAGLPIEILKEYVALVHEGDETRETRKKILVDQREVLLQKMKEMQETINLLDYKIEVYENEMLEAEKKLK